MTNTKIKTGKNLSVAALLFLSACATNFTGNPHIEKQACVQKCKAWGMQISGMVAMGEYSDACICKVPGAGTASVEGFENFLASSAASGAGAAGVVMQMRRAAQQAQH